MPRVVEYQTDKERRRVIEQTEAEGMTMLHDDFLEDGTKRLMFDTLPEIVPSADELRLIGLRGKLEQKIIIYQELVEMLRLERRMP